MSAQEVTSEVIIKNIDGSASQFRTITTHENTKVQKTVIQQSISEEKYNELDSKLQGGSSNGIFFKNIRTDQNGVNLYTTNVSEEVIRQLNDPKTKFKRELDLGSIDAILKFEEDIPPQQRQFSKFGLYEQYPSLQNVAFDIVTGEEIPADVGKDFAGQKNTSFKLESFEIAAKDRKLQYDNLFYPEDIATNKQDRVVFKMFYQSGRDLDFSLERGNNLFTFGKRKTTNILGSVTLPIQGGIADQNTVSYQDGTLNPVSGVLASVSLDPFRALSEAASLLNKNVGELQDALNTPASQNVINVLRTYLAQTAVGAEGLIPRTTGAILNPNIELLLKAPNLRSFNFNFRMSARSRTEAEQIRKIIRFFKQGMTVKRSTSSLFILTPNLFKIQYKTGSGDDHPSIGKIKNCAMTAINTQYTPDGTYMTFDDEARTMTSYNIQMQFKELEPLTETDYAETVPREDSIGY
jgi:hypothetical protein